MKGLILLAIVLVIVGTTVFAAWKSRQALRLREAEALIYDLEKQCLELTGTGDLTAEVFLDQIRSYQRAIK